MKSTLRRHDWLIALTVCLAFGGIGAAFILCFLIGFGLHTFVGKEALYVAFVLQALNLAVIRLRERQLRLGGAPTASVKMRRVHLCFAWSWRVGALCLLLSLVLALCGVSFGSPWVRIPCIVGTILTPLGWLGALASLHRRRQAALVASERESL